MKYLIGTLVKMVVIFTIKDNEITNLCLGFVQLVCFLLKKKQIESAKIYFGKTILKWQMKND